MTKQDELPIIRRMYDLVLCYVPGLYKLPRGYNLALGDRIQAGLLHVLETQIRAKYRKDKRPVLEKTEFKKLYGASKVTNCDFKMASWTWRHCLT